MIIGIIGLTGTGKSTIAARVAQELDFHLFDMDVELPEEYRDRHRKGEFVPARDVIIYQRLMIARMLELERAYDIVLAGFFLTPEFPDLIEKTTSVLWINLITTDCSMLTQRIRSRKEHFVVNTAVLSENWAIQHQQVFGNIFIDCSQDIEAIVKECISYLKFNKQSKIT